MTLNLDNIDLGSFGIKQAAEEEPGRTSVDDIIRVTSGEQQLKSTMNQAVQVNPDQQAEINKLSRESGIPAPAVQADPNQVKTHLNLSKINFDEMSKRQPNTAKFLTEYKNATIAHDDVSVLGKIENVLKDHIGAVVAGGVEFPGMGLSGLGSAYDAAGRLIARGTDAVLPESMDKYIWRQSDTPGFVKKINELTDFGLGFNYAGSQLKGIAEAVGPEEATFTTDVARGLGQLVGQLATYMASPQAALPLLFGQGADIQAQKQQVTGTEGATVAADLAVLLGGAVTAGTERVQIDTFLKRLPPEIKNTLLKQITDIGIAGSAEAAQEVIEGVAQNLLELYTTNPDAEIIEGLEYEAAVAGTTGAIAQTIINLIETALPGKVRTVRADTETQQTQAAVDQATLDNINKAATESKLRERDAETFKQFIEQNDGDNNITVFIDGAQAALYLAEKTVEEVQADPALSLLSSQVAESQSLGTDVQIPVADFATHFAGTDHFTMLRDSMTMRESTVSPFRQEQAQAESEAYITSIMTEAENNASEYVQAQEIFATVRDQLIDTGAVNAANASIMAQIVPAWATVQATNRGIPVEQVYRESGLTIEGPQTGEAARLSDEALTQAQVIDQLKADDLISEISEFSQIDNSGLVTVYHRTTKENADKIKSTGKMTPKEDGIFFSTKKDGQAEGFGDSIVEFKIPADQLELDDIFDDEAHLRLPATINKANDISAFIDREQFKQEGLTNEQTRRRPEAVDGQPSQQAIIEQAQNRNDEEILAEFERAKTGETVTFLHRTFNEFDAFDDSQLGQNTSTPSANLGHFLAAGDVGNPERYGDLNTVHQFTLQKPLVISADTFESVMGNLTPEQVTERREALMNMGHDGILIDGLNWAIVFEGKNIQKLEEDFGDLDQFILNQDQPVENLAVTHNLSAENIIAANNLGGLAAPSIAVIRTDTSDFDAFGEVSLLADPSFLSDRSIRTFGADVYSPRQPRAEYDVDTKKTFEFKKEVKDSIGDLDLRIFNESEMDSRGADELLNSEALQYYWLKEQGKAPKPKKEKVAPEVSKIAKLVGQGTFIGDFVNDPKIVKLATDYTKKEYESIPEEIREEVADHYFETNEDGSVNFDQPLKRHIEKPIHAAISLNRKSGIDINTLRQDIAKKMRVKKNETEFEKYVTDKFNELNKGERLFKGFTASGNRRYVEYNLENVVKEMTKTIRGGENFNYGVGNIRAANVKEFKNLEQIKADRDKIVTAEEMEAVKEESSEHFDQVLEELRKYYKYDADGWGYMNDAASAIAEGPKGWREAFKPEAVPVIKEFISYLSTLPTDYFEAKAQRAVDFSEFNTAVVPKGMRKDALQILKDAGLKIKTYDPKGEGKTRQQVISEQQKLLFQETKTNKSARGYYDPANSVIRLTESADLSTFLHEFAHFMYEMELTNKTPLGESINNWFKRNVTEVAKEANTYLDRDAAEALGQELTNIQPGDVDIIETGKPVKFRYMHNTESATKMLGIPDKDSPFGRGYEPSGKYVTIMSERQEAPDSDQFETGYITLNNPLVVDNDSLQWKKTLSDQYGGKTGKKLSKAIIAAGYDGIITTENGRYISEIVDFTSFDESKALFQTDTPTGKPGEITPEHVITYLDNGTTGNAAIDAAIRRATHEQFARGFETYLMEGKAPSVELRNAFRSFARWLTQIYKSIRGDLKVNLDDEMRQVFARLLATDEQIAAAEARARVEPMFTDAAMAGMTEEEFAAYQKRQAKVKDKQTETLRDKLIQQLTRQTKAWWKQEKQDIIDEITPDLLNEPVYRTRNALKNGQIKLDHATVKEMVGETKTDKLGRESVRVPAAFKGMTAKGQKGVHPDEAAAFFGYDSGSQLLDDLMTAPPLEDVAESRAEAEMVKRHGDILTDGTIEKEADEAVQNEERGKLILSELKALSRNTASAARMLEREQIKSIAKDRIGKLNFREIHPGKYRKAEITAAAEAARQLQAGNREAAIQAKARQVMNYYLGMEATKAKNETVKIVDRMARYNKKSVREEIMKAGQGYWEQLAKILNRFEFRKSATLGQVESLNTWVKERIEIDGDGLVLTPEVLNESYVTHWKNVPFSELQGINDSVKNIEHVARYANKITRGQEEIDFNKLVSKWTTSIAEKAGAKFKTFASEADKANKAAKWGRWAMAQMTKIPFMASWLDGGERVGLSHQILVQPFTDAYDTEIKLWAEAGKPVMDAIERRSKEDKKRHNRKIFIPEIKGTAAGTHTGNLMGHEILAVALNTGNQSNLKKMLLGEGWANPDVEEEISFNNPKLQAVLKHMTRSDWELVQLIWDQMETLYPQLAEVHRRTTGLTPPKVESTPVETRFGTFKGGYYPVKYDPNRDHKAAMNEEKLNAETESMFSNSASIQASVNASATNERTGYYAPIRLSLDVVPAHFQETIHYITHHDAVRETNKLLRNKEVASTIKAALGPEEFAQLKPWLNDIAKDGREAPQKMFWDSMLQRLRFGVTLGAMGFKASTGIIQVSGLSNTIAEVGHAPVYQAVRTILGSRTTMKSAWEFAVENSKVMEHRTQTMDREIKNAMKRLEGKQGLLAAVQEVSMKHIALIQTYMVDLPSWHAAYIKGMSDHGDETRAYQYADWVVENVQGSGATKDLARIMRGQSETGRMFTMFMTFFSSLWNLERDLVKGVKSGRYSTTSIAAKLMFLFTVPVLFEMLMRGEFADDEEDDETNLQKMLTGVAMYPVQSVPFVRDVANAVTGDFGYNISPLQSVIEQGTQTIPEIVVRGFTDEEITKGQVKGATKFIGAATGIPGTAQAWATGEHLFNVMVEGEELTLRELLFGPDN